MSAIKPLQAVCSEPKCRRRQVVPADRIWYVDVRQGPGTHRQAGWSCRACGRENTTPPSHLPKGTVLLLPSKAKVVEAIQAEMTARAVAEAERLRRTAINAGASTRPKAQAVATIPTTAPAPKSITAEAPAVANDDPEVDQQPTIPARAAPQWVTGTPAKAVLIEALRRISHHGGDAMAVANGRRGFEADDVSLPDDDADDAHIQRMADIVLEELDRMRADVLVLGGEMDGREWQAVLHYRAGAASFT